MASTRSWSATSIFWIFELCFSILSCPPSHASRAAPHWKQVTQFCEETIIWLICTSRIQFCGGEWLHLSPYLIFKYGLSIKPHLMWLNRKRIKKYYFNFSISGKKSALNTEWNCHDFYLLLYYSLWINWYIEYGVQYNLSRFYKIMKSVLTWKDLSWWRCAYNWCCAHSKVYT